MQRAAVRSVVVWTVVLLLFCPQAWAQGLPAEPLVIGDGRVVIGGDLSLTASCSHAAGAAACTGDTGFFNFSSYSDSTLRMLRAGLSTSVRISRHLSALGALRFENGEAPTPYALYLRVKPFDSIDFDIQAGRIPSSFGAFSRRAYSTDNPLIGYPLAYQYLTSLRPDAVPADPDDLIRMRGRGWLSSFPIGNPTPEAGLPLADAFDLDTGVQAHVGTNWIDSAVSLTSGSLSDPRVGDDNRGKHLAGRIAVKPAAGLMVGVSASRAPYVAKSAAVAAQVDENGFVQRAFGFDVEYSRDHYLVRWESVLSTYDLPVIRPRLRALATALESRYKLTPRVYVAGRLDHLGFNTVTGATRTATWDAPVTRWEVATGYALQRNMQLRMSFQHNVRDGGRVRRMQALSTQLLYWF
jgi:hypothetical protein